MTLRIPFDDQETASLAIIKEVNPRPPRRGKAMGFEGQIGEEDGEVMRVYTKMISN